jgi:chaperone required for assembly of F1-ATPase
MRELFEEFADKSPLDPNEAARRNMRASSRRRFYKTAGVAGETERFAVTLDGKRLRTPARHEFAVPFRAVAEAAAAEWAAQGERIDPAEMPLTRLLNSIIDGVIDRPAAVADDIARYFETDLVVYRADHPEGLVTMQEERWDPVLDWAARELGARFVRAIGVMHVEQPRAAIEAARAAMPADPWRLGALHAATTLTGSALVALALMRGGLDSESAWAAAHVDEDWNFRLWGDDPTVLARRAARFREFAAAASVLAAANSAPLG